MSDQKSIQLANVELQYKKFPTLRKDDVEEIQKWLQNQSHLPQITELQILLFLHSCQNDLKQTQKAINFYFKFKMDYPQFCCHVDEDVVRRVLATGFMSILPEKTADGCIVLWMKLLNASPRNYECTNFQKVTMMIIALYLHQHGCNNGLIMVMDTQGFSLGHITRFNWISIKTFSIFVQEAMPLKIRAIHYFNVGYWMQKVMGLVKPFMKKEVADLTDYSSGLSEIETFLPKTVIPKDYGGQGETLSRLSEDTLQSLLSNFDFFKWHDRQVNAK